MKRILLLAVFGGFALLLSGCSGTRKAEQLGLLDGRLRPCPSSPNCVSSKANDITQQVESFQLQVAPEEAWTVVKQTIPALPRTQLISENDDYLHAERRSAVFGFIDDLELLLIPEQQQIAVRSAARLGYYDFGANRKLVEELRRQLRAAGVVR